MGIPVLILGESGSGKSCAMRNFKPNDVGVFNVAGKPLPFRQKLKMVNHATYNKIMKALSKPTMKTYVIDDSQYLLCFEMFDKANETGYNKFTDMAVHFYSLIKYVIEQTPEDVIVYFLHHTERTDGGGVKAKTIGKMLDEKLTVEGLFSIVLLAKTDGKRYWFETQSDGLSTAKSPMGMFEKEIDNDLTFVDRAIRGYWDDSGNIEATLNDMIETEEE